VLGVIFDFGVIVFIGLIFAFGKEGVSGFLFWLGNFGNRSRAVFWSRNCIHTNMVSYLTKINKVA